jgi:hypothetical protein
MAGLCGIAGPMALTVYFAAPALTNWPYAGASAAQLTAYATGHQTLFFAGAWFQATGTLLSIVFFLAIVQLAGAPTRLPGLVVIVASAALLSLVLVEAALLIEVPLAAANGDSAAVVTTFALSNGVFARVFPLAPASATYIGLGVVILGSRVMHRGFGYVAVGLGVAFEVAGIVAVFTIVGLILAIVLSMIQSSGSSPPRSPFCGSAGNGPAVYYEQGPREGTLGRKPKSWIGNLNWWRCRFRL